jgi:hypothetical protein
MTRKLADEYKRAGKADWAASLLADSESMVKLMTQAVKPGKDGGKTFVVSSLLMLQCGLPEVSSRKMAATCMPTSVSLSLGVGMLILLVPRVPLDGPFSMT